MPINISAYFPDMLLKESTFSDALTHIAIRLADLNNSLDDNKLDESWPEIDLRFMLTGEHDRPEFSGMRIRNYDPEEKAIVIEAAVPEHINQSSLAWEYIMAAVQDATENASDFFSEVNQDFDVSWYMDQLKQFKKPGSGPALN